MSPSPVIARRRIRRPPRRFRRRNRTPKRAAISTVAVMAIRARMPAIGYALVVTAAWLIATGTYFAFRDDVLTRLISVQTELQSVYEDRIAQLRAQVDRIMSQKLLDQEQVEQRVNALLQRQAHILLSLDKVEQKQAATLSDLEERIDTRASQMHSVLSELGINIGRAAAEGATGGPFVPVMPSQSTASAFEAQLYRINMGRAQIDRYRQTLVALPVRKPLIGEIHMTSPFGMRMHPLLGRLAIHTGIDLRGDVGVPVRATATGKVTIAGRQGGYGNMVEISHGNGLATRFGHLSEISVKIGQVVRIGEMVGRIGSTGRSTGPHLHYETRVNGEAVDPQKFLHAGLTLGDSLDATALPVESHAKKSAAFAVQLANFDSR
jgi:murein DD-endopeptidase MepM/ murein hydrolase activator NlpD